MKSIIVFALIASITLAAALPQGHGTITGPSGLFDMTKFSAAQPVDLTQPIILLREATPIHEEAQEPRPQTG